MEDTQRTLVVLLTMHRSGSSVATSILHRLGMSLGPFELVGASPTNSHGYFEAAPILELNQDVQKLVYGFAQDLPESEEALGEFVGRQGMIDWPEIPAHLLSKGQSLIEQLLESGTISGFKDPRTVLLWPFWERVLTAFPKVRVAPVALLRSPHEIAMSLSSRVAVAHGMYAYWDCLDVVAIHFNRLKRILDDGNLGAPVVRFGSPSFLDDLAETARYCGLMWDAEHAAEMIDNSCVHHVAARVPHESQHVYDSLCGQCALFDPRANQDQLNADARVSERLVWTRVRRFESAAKSTLDLLMATQTQLTQSQVDSRQDQEELNRAHQQLRTAHDQVRAAHDKVRDTNNQLRAAHDQLRETNDQLRAAHDQVRETNDQLRAAHDQVRETNDQLRAAHDQVRETNDQLREAHDQASDANDELHEARDQVRETHDRLRDAYEQLREAHDQARHLSQKLRETYEQLHGSQEHNANLMEVIRQTNLALEHSNLDVHNLQQLCNEQQQNLGKFEEHPVLGVALRGRRRLRRALHTLKLRSAG